MSARHIFYVCVAATFLASIACMPSGDVGAPIVWPDRAYQGETIAVAVDSNHIPSGVFETHQTSGENAALEIQDDTGWVPLTVRTVIAGAAAESTEFAANNPGSMVSVALVDLPTNLTFAGGYPAETYVRIVGDAGPLPAPFDGEMTILGPSSDPQAKGPRTFYPPQGGNWGGVKLTGAIEEDLEARPMVRLRFQKSSGLQSTPIGSVEFEITHPSGAVPTEVIPHTEAAAGTALFGPGSQGGTRVVLVHPQGFEMVPAGQVLGSGPFLDVVIDKSQPFDTSEFAIKDLLVTDLDGNALIDERGTSDSTGQFELYALRNQ